MIASQFVLIAVEDKSQFPLPANSLESKSSLGLTNTAEVTYNSKRYCIEHLVRVRDLDRIGEFGSYRGIALAIQPANLTAP